MIQVQLSRVYKSSMANKFRQLPKGVTRACRVALQERERLVNIFGLG